MTPTPNAVWVRFKHAPGGIMLRLDRIDPADQVFSWRNASDGRFLHWHVQTLAKVADKQPLRTCALTPALVDFLLSNSGVEIEHLARIPPERLEVPGLMLDMPDGTNIIVDGVHRCVRRARDGRGSIDMRVFTEGEARIALLDLPEMFGEALGLQ